MNYTVVTEPAKKVVITISRKQLWDNYANAWKEMLWDGVSDVGGLKEVSDVLCADGPMDFLKIRGLFRRGDTVLLLNDAMDLIDVPRVQNVYAEVIVTDTDGKTVTVRHEDLNY